MNRTRRQPFISNSAVKVRGRKLSIGVSPMKREEGNRQSASRERVNAAVNYLI